VNFELKFESRAAKELEKLGPDAAERIRERLRFLVDHVDDSPREMLTGRLRGLLKLRIGDYRVAYVIDRQSQTVIVHMVGHRREFYDIDDVDA
jgi:mRNA interferase RelE/StbE